MLRKHTFFSLFPLFLSILSLIQLAIAQEGVRIGDLSTIDHDVEGTVFAVNSRTLRIDNFKYDGQGPAGVYWVDTGDSATREGVTALTKDSCEAEERLPAFDGTTSVTIELPNDLTLSDIGYFSIWCVSVGVEFGGIKIDASALSGVADLDSPTCAPGGGAAPAAPAAPAAEPVLIGELSTLDHDVEGTVFAVNSRTLRIDNFKYDGQGPAGVYWVDTGDSATREGVTALTKDSCEAEERLPAFDGTTSVTIELPNDLTLSDIGYFSIWCVSVGVEFGGIKIDASALSGVADLDSPTCAPGGGAAPAAPAAPAADPVRIGELSTLDHDVEGTVFAVDSRTLRIDNFKYDGEGPAGVYWIDTGDSATREGVTALTKDSCEAEERLPAFDGTTSVTIELPNDLTLSDIGYFSIWCVSVGVEFGGIKIDASALSGVADAPSATCSGMNAAFPVQEGWNCEPLTESYQVRWLVSGDDLNVELVALNSGSGRYMGFGVSGSDSATQMVGSDVAIAYTDGSEFKAVDYLMTSRSPCAGGAGVCPDTAIAQNPGNDDITKISGETSGEITMVRYTRPLAAADSDTDRAISTNGPTFVSWALGPFNSDTQLPMFHAGEMSFPRSDVSFSFGREASNNCANIGSPDSGEAATVPGFIRPTLSGETEITARIGPSAGARGYAGITNGTAWGISWYLSKTGTTNEDVIIPALGVERGKTYTFTVHGGVETDSIHHPFYLTDDPRGGYAEKTPAERAQETVYAGIDVKTRDGDNGVTEFESTAMGAICQITGGPSETDTIATWEDYAKDLDFSCENNETITNNAGKLTWTVPDDAPDELYYQCVTHQFLGFKVLVFDEGQVDEQKLVAANNGGELNRDSSEEVEEKVCKATFKGEEKTFDGCTNIETLEVFWNFKEDEGEFETLFRAPNAGYVGIGWGYDKMVGSNSAIVYDAGSNITIDDYELTEQSTRGVQPATNQQLKNSDAAKDGDFLVGMFTRPISVPGLPTIERGSIPLIWSIGTKPTSGTTLERHTSRGSSSVNLAASGSSSTSGGGSSSSQKRLFQAHGALMGIAWLLLTPTAVLAMGYFKKWNPLPFEIHRGLNTLSVLLTVIAFIMAVAKGSHTELAHLGIGVVVTFLALVQAALGIFRPDHESKSRRFWFILHVSIGFVALALAHTNVFIGIGSFNKIFGLPNPVALWWALAGVAVGVYVLLHFIFNFKPGRTSPPEIKT